MVTPVTLSGPNGYGMYTYTWAPVSSSNQSIQVSTSGTYSLTVNNGQGCVYTDVIVVNILPTTVQEAAVVPVNVFPNPATDVVTVQSAGTITAVNILDLNGRLVQTQACASTQTDINIGALPDGCYIVETIT